MGISPEPPKKTFCKVTVSEIRLDKLMSKRQIRERMSQTITRYFGYVIKQIVNNNRLYYQVIVALGRFSKHSRS